MNIAISNFFNPAPALKEFILHYWLIAVSGSDCLEAPGHSQIHLPTGFIDLYFCCNDSSCSFVTRSGKFTVNSMIVCNRPIGNKIITTDFSLPFRGVRVRFTYQGFYLLCCISSQELYDEEYMIDTVLGDGFKCFYDRYENAQDDYERKKLLDEYFLKVLNEKYSRRSNYNTFNESLHLIGQYNGNIRIKSLINHLGISERSLELCFKKFLGVSPKEFCSLNRAIKVIEYMNNSKSINWHDIIYNFGFYDQSHFIKSFEQVTGVSPEWFMKNKGDKVFLANSFLVFPNQSEMKLHVRDSFNYIENTSHIQL